MEMSQGWKCECYQCDNVDQLNECEQCGTVFCEYHQLIDGCCPHCEAFVRIATVKCNERNVTGGE